jgi:hypothetical protein
MDRPLRPFFGWQLPQGVAPTIDSFFSRINLLPASNKTHTHAPIRMSTHDFKQETWLGLFAFEFLRPLTSIPSPLGFIENDGVLMGACGIRAA